MTEKNNLKNVIIEYKKLGKLNLDKLLNNQKLFNKKEDKHQRKNNSKSKNEEKNSLTTEEYISSSQLDVETMTYVKPTPKNRNNIILNNKKKEGKNCSNFNQNLNKKLMMKTRDYIKYQIFTNHRHNLTLSNSETINNIFKSKFVKNKSSCKSKEIPIKKLYDEKPIKSGYKKDEKKEKNLINLNHNINNSKVKANNYYNQNYDNKYNKCKKQLTINLNYINSINNFNNVNNINSSENINFTKINKTIDNNTSKNKDNLTSRKNQRIDLINKNILKESVLLREGKRYRIINLNNANKGKTKGRLDLTSIPSTEKIRQIQVNKSKKNYIIKKNRNNNAKGRNNDIINKNNEILLEENEISDNENSNKNLSYKKYKTSTVNKGIVKGSKKERKINKKSIYPCHSYYPNKIKKNLLMQENDSNCKKEKQNLITRNKKLKGKNMLSYDLNYTNFSNVNNNINKFFKRNISEFRAERSSANNKYSEKMSIDTFFGSANNNTQINEKSISRSKSKNNSIAKSSNTSKNKNRIINRNKSCNSNEIKIMRKSYGNGSENLWKISSSILNSNKDKGYKNNRTSFETDNIREFDEFNYEQNNDNFYKLNSNFNQFILNNKKLYDNLYNFNSRKYKRKDKDIFRLVKISINNKKNKTQRNTLRNNSLSLRRDIKNNHIFKKGPCHSAQRDYKYFNKKKLNRNKNKISIEIENSNINNNFNINLFKKASIYFKINRTTKNN